MLDLRSMQAVTAVQMAKEGIGSRSKVRDGMEGCVNSRSGPRG